jgi:hypothetical protein
VVFPRHLFLLTLFEPATPPLDCCLVAPVLLGRFRLEVRHFERA